MKTFSSSLCLLCVLCVSVVKSLPCSPFTFASTTRRRGSRPRCGFASRGRMARAFPPLGRVVGVPHRPQRGCRRAPRSSVASAGTTSTARARSRCRPACRCGCRPTKGPEYTPLDETVTLGAGQMALRFAIERWTDSRADGWVSVDTRCHFLSPHAALLEAAAEDVDVVNLLAAPFPVLASRRQHLRDHAEPARVQRADAGARKRDGPGGRREHAQHAPGTGEGRAVELAPAGLPARVRRRRDRRLVGVRLVRPVPPQGRADGVGRCVRAGRRH